MRRATCATAPGRVRPTGRSKTVCKGNPSTNGFGGTRNRGTWATFCRASCAGPSLRRFRLMDRILISTAYARETARTLVDLFAEHEGDMGHIRDFQYGAFSMRSFVAFPSELPFLSIWAHSISHPDLSRSDPQISPVREALSTDARSTEWPCPTLASTSGH
jgi:hypothetical protein